MSLRAVLWDLGGVLLRTHDASGRRRWEARLGLAEGELDRLVFGCQASRAATLGRAGVDDIWSEVLASLGLPESERETLSRDFFAGDRLDKRLLDFLRQLRSSHKTGLITNAWPNVRPWIDGEWGLADLFDLVLISAEVGLAKPDPRIYQLAVERLGVAPQEAVFIDDAEENVEGAMAVGLHALRFESTDQVLSELRRLLSS